MYLSPLLSGDLWRTYGENTTTERLFSAFPNKNVTFYVNIIRRKISSLTLTNVSTAPLATSSNVGRPPKYALWFIDAEVSMRKTMIVISNITLRSSSYVTTNAPYGDNVRRSSLPHHHIPSHCIAAASSSSWKPNRPNTPRRPTPRDLLRHDWSRNQWPYIYFHIVLIQRL
jgi:hypothetical protein